MSSTTLPIPALVLVTRDVCDIHCLISIIPIQSSLWYQACVSMFIERAKQGYHCWINIRVMCCYCVLYSCAFALHRRFYSHTHMQSFHDERSSEISSSQNVCLHLQTQISNHPQVLCGDSFIFAAAKRETFWNTKINIRSDKAVFCFCGSELAAGFAAAKRDSLRHASGLLFLQSWVFVGVKSTGILQEQITAKFELKMRLFCINIERAAKRNLQMQIFE